MAGPALLGLTAIPISIDVDFDSTNNAGIALGGAGGANSAQDLSNCACLPYTGKYQALLAVINY